MYLSFHIIFPDGTKSSRGDHRQSAITIDDIHNVMHLTFSVTAEDIHKTIEIDIDHSQLTEPVHEECINISASVDVMISESYQTKVGENTMLNLPLTVGGELVEATDEILSSILRDASAEFVFMNTSNEPHSFDVIKTSGFSDIDNGIAFAGPRTADREKTVDTINMPHIKLHLTLRQSYAQYGGMLTVSLKSSVTSNLIKELRTIRYSLILMQNRNKAFPHNCLALHTQDRAYVSPVHGSIYCSATGSSATRRREKETVDRNSSDQGEDLQKDGPGNTECWRRQG